MSAIKHESSVTNTYLHAHSCSFTDAWWFGLQTVTTIGYGLPPGHEDIYFNGCVSLWFIIDISAGG